MKEKIIFDLDGTLMNADFSLEDDFFRERLGKNDADKFVPVKYDLLLKYEDLFSRYDIKCLSEFLTIGSGVNITEKLIREWLLIGSTFKDDLVPDIVDVLEYLKSKDYELIVLSNWFKSSQDARLKKAGLYKFFTATYMTESFPMKPNKEAFEIVKGKYKENECVMVGDNFEVDIKGAIAVGMNAIYLNKNDKSIEQNSHVMATIHNIQELKQVI